MLESEYPLVSICMPVYNGARFLSYTIDNILAQSYRNIELIIVCLLYTSPSPRDCS